jgi:flagellar biosynthetic protein FliO
MLGVAESVETPAYGWFLLETLVVLAVVCVLAWLVLRFWVRRAYAGQSRGPIRVLARAPLEPRRTLYVIEVGGKCLLIGSGEGPLANLGEVDGAKVRVALAAEQARPSFLTVLRGGRKHPIGDLHASDAVSPASGTPTEPVSASAPDPASEPARVPASAPVAVPASAPVAVPAPAPVAAPAPVPDSEQVREAADAPARSKS